MIYVQDSIDGLFPLLEKEREIIVVIDKNVDDIYGQYVHHKKIVIEPSEEFKTLSMVEHVIKELLFLEATRDCLIIAAGGGVTTDIVGFTASIYKRGVRFAFVPTTLVGQIDASIGGKTGVNFAGYKNIVGLINQPEFTYIDTGLLRTLPHREFASGVSELLKTFIIGDAFAYHRAVDLFRGKPIYSGDFFKGEELETFGKLVNRAIEIKSAIVKDDVEDMGGRRVLNLGHTFGHAIEKMMLEEGTHHGEAVSIGMAITAKISVKMGLASQETADEIIRDLESMGLPVKSNIPEYKLITAIRNDKKREGDSINFVFINRIGSVSVAGILIDKLEELAYDLR